MSIIKKIFRNTMEKGDKGIGKRAKDNKSGLCGFHYSFDGTIGRNNYSYDVKKTDGATVFEYKSLEHEDLGEMKKTVDNTASPNGTAFQDTTPRYATERDFLCPYASTTENPYTQAVLTLIPTGIKTFYTM